MSDFSFSGLNQGSFDKNYRKVKKNKEALVDWLNDNIKDLGKRGNLKLKDIEGTTSLYERKGWSRPDDNGNVKIRLEVRGKNVFLSESDAMNGNYFMVPNDFDIVKDTMEKMVKQLNKADDNMNLYYVVREDGTRKVKKL